jgi:NADH dehydrogenase
VHAVVAEETRKGRAVKIAITGGTGFVGRTLAARLSERGHRVVVIARGRDDRDKSVCLLKGVTLVHASVTDERRLQDAFEGCESVGHLAGVTRDLDGETLRDVHVRGTANALSAAEVQGVSRFVMLSTTRAGTDTGSALHDSKGAAELLVRASLASHTIVRADVIYGKGDRMLDHLEHALRVRPIFPLIGYQRPTVRPVAVGDVVSILADALTGDDLGGQTVAAEGPDAMCLSDVVRTVGVAVTRRPWFVRVPLWAHRSKSTALEQVMNLPLAARRGTGPEGSGPGDVSVSPLPPHLQPTVGFTIEGIRARLPDRAFGRISQTTAA